MSNTQLVFIDRSRIPHRAALQSSIDDLGFDLQLDPDYMPFDDAGFSPCVIGGREGFGFEVHYGPADEVVSGNADLAAIAAGRDSCMQLVWHGSMNDLACAMIVSAALVRDHGAVVSYEGQPPEAVEQIVAAAHMFVAEGQGEATPLSEPESNAPTVDGRNPWWKWW
jgi:hypothetical protein